MENEIRHTLLVVDDEPANLQKLKRTFLGRYRVYEAVSAEEALGLAEKVPVDLVITDQRMPRMTGVELLKRIIRIRPEAMRIILTGYTDTEDLIDAINEGHVYRYITKPWEPEEMRIVVRQALEKLELERENRRLAEELRVANDRLKSQNRALQNDVKRFIDTDNFIVHSPAMNGVVRAADRVAVSESTILIFGETGTGKELVARRIHRGSPRRGGPFVAVNCGAIPRELAESEFFGWKKGAFSGATNDRKGYFQLAEGGTLFLDEIGEAPLDLQVKMLRVLQNREIWPVGAERPVTADVRVVASTNRDLRAEVERGAFREDLYFRLSVFVLEVPPLRERVEDIRPLADFFLSRAWSRTKQRPLPVEERVYRALERFNWPGNVRQLENEAERLALLADPGRPVGLECLSRYLLPPEGAEGGDFDGAQTGPDGPTLPAPGPDGEDLDLRRNVDALEARLVREALARTGGNRTHAAALLGITRPSLLDRMKKLEIK